MLTKWTRLVAVAVLFVALSCWLQGQRSGIDFPCLQQAAPAAAQPQAESCTALSTVDCANYISRFYRSPSGVGTGGQHPGS